ncbi:MAG: PadR family transcriptional regulator [Bacteroidetes bacterium]|nr:PadR family transcriptional regulator [Bacteroidota bacterium]
MSTLNGNDEILMLTILALGSNAYGATMMKHLTKVTGKEWSIGAIYDPLYRLEKNDMIQSEITNPTAERGGRSKRLYKLTKKGNAALREHQRVRSELTDGIPHLA